jgi:hypothetical protein
MYLTTPHSTVAVMSGRPSRFWTDQNPGAPTMFVFALP